MRLVPQERNDSVPTQVPEVRNNEGGSFFTSSVRYHKEYLLQNVLDDRQGVLQSKQGGI